MTGKTVRMCVSCRKRDLKANFLRAVKEPQTSKIIFDESGKLDGRGAYVCKDTSCIQRCIKSRGLNRAFKKEVEKEVYNKIMEAKI